MQLTSTFPAPDTATAELAGLPAGTNGDGVPPEQNSPVFAQLFPTLNSTETAGPVPRPPVRTFPVAVAGRTHAGAAGAGSLRPGGCFAPTVQPPVGSGVATVPLAAGEQILPAEATAGSHVSCLLSALTSLSVQDLRTTIGAMVPSDECAPAHIAGAPDDASPPAAGADAPACPPEPANLIVATEPPTPAAVVIPASPDQRERGPVPATGDDGLPVVTDAVGLDGTVPVSGAASRSPVAPGVVRTADLPEPRSDGEGDVHPEIAAGGAPVRGTRPAPNPAEPRDGIAKSDVTANAPAVAPQARPPGAPGPDLPARLPVPQFSTTTHVVPEVASAVGETIPISATSRPGADAPEPADPTQGRAAPSRDAVPAGAGRPGADEPSPVRRDHVSDTAGVPMEPDAAGTEGGRAGLMVDSPLRSSGAAGRAGEPAAVAETDLNGAVGPARPDARRTTARGGDPADATGSTAPDRDAFEYQIDGYTNRGPEGGPATVRTAAARPAMVAGGVAAGRPADLAAVYGENLPRVVSGGKEAVRSFLSASPDAVMSDEPAVGTGVAKSVPVMATNPFPRPSSSEPDGRLVPPAVMNEAAGASKPGGAAASADSVASAAFRAVNTIVEATERLATGATQTLNLRFSVGGSDLAVRVERREDGLHATFRTDSPELRTALAQEWQAVSGSEAGRPLRAIEPVFVSAKSPAADAALGEGASQQQRHSDARQTPDAPAPRGPATAVSVSHSARDSGGTAVRSAPLPTTLRLHAFA